MTKKVMYCCLLVTYHHWPCSHGLQEATACGLKVADAKRVLKLMQSLEAAQTSTTSDGTTPHRTLKARLEAAEQGGVSASFLEPARFQLRKLLMTDVKKVRKAVLCVLYTSQCAFKEDKALWHWL